jgi:uncharacterized membrane protein
MMARRFRRGSGEMIREWLVSLTENATLLINGMALIVIVFGTVEAFGAGVRAMMFSLSGHERREIWLRYARWLVAGLTFQLAADIIETAIAPSWSDIGHLAAIAAIRTFLNYFLERDLVEMRARQHEFTEPAKS